MKILIIAMAITAFLAVIVGCRKGDSDQEPGDKTTGNDSSARMIVVGGLYASQNEDGTFGVMKVLAVDDFAVHLCSYKNKFQELPRDLDSSILSLGGISDPDGFGIGHFPLAKEGFWNGNPVFLKQESVRDEELDGYRLYLEAMQQ